MKRDEEYAAVAETLEALAAALAWTGDGERAPRHGEVRVSD
jgi:hypothetical protein